MFGTHSYDALVERAFPLTIRGLKITLLEEWHIFSQCLISNLTAIHDKQICSCFSYSMALYDIKSFSSNSMILSFDVGHNIAVEDRYFT